MVQMAQLQTNPSVPVSGVVGTKNAAKTLVYLTVDNKNISIPSAKTLLDAPTPYQEYDIYRLSPNLTTSPNTIVTAYFRVKSKYDSSKYDAWMANFLSLQDHMVIFTQEELFPQIMRLRSHALDRTVMIMMKVDDIPIGQLYPSEFWEDQLERDVEKAKHKSYQLFWIWLNKVWATNEAIRLNFFQSDLFMWADIGSLRDGFCKSCTLIQHREQVPPHEMMQMAFQEPVPPPGRDMFWDKTKDAAYFYHSGMHFVAFKDTWTQFNVYFLEMIDRFLEKEYPICDDQVVLQSVCLTHPEICAYVPASQVRDYRFRGLRYVLHNGGQYNLWRYTKSKQ